MNRSPLSDVNSLVDWQAASLALGLGVGPRTGGKGRSAQKAIGRPAFTAEVTAVAQSILLFPFVELLREHPEASHVKAQQHFRYEGKDGDIRVMTLGVATLTLPGGREIEVFSDKWFFKPDTEDWDRLSTEDAEIYFTLAKDDVDAFTIGDVTCYSALAEIVLQEHRFDLDPKYAAEHVRSLYGENRVAQGKPPARWGAPGLKMIDAYLAAGGKPSAMDAAGTTPLAAALYLQQGNIVRKLVDAGADVAAPAAGGLYPIDIAVLTGSVDVVRLCCELGASPNTGGYLQPILRAVEVRSSEIFGALLDQGANMDVETQDGVTLAEYVDDTDATFRETCLSLMTARSVERAMHASDSEMSAGPRLRSRSAGMSL